MKPKKAMKKIIYFLITLLIGVGCISKEDWEKDVLDVDKALQRAQDSCGQASMDWFSEMLRKAEEDRLTKAHKGSYIGFVSLVKYENSSVFYTNFMSKVGGGLMFYLMDCQGNQFDASSIVAEDMAFFSKEAYKKKNIIYSNVPLEFFD